MTTTGVIAERIQMPMVVSRSVGVVDNDLLISFKTGHVHFDSTMKMSESFHAGKLDKPNF